MNGIFQSFDFNLIKFWQPSTTNRIYPHPQFIISYEERIYHSTYGVVHVSMDTCAAVR